MDMKIAAREKMRITAQRRSNAAISISGVVAMACACQWKNIAIMWWIAQIKVTRIASLNQAPLQSPETIVPTIPEFSLATTLASL